MTPTQLKALLDAAKKRPWIIATPMDHVAIMNAAEALVALWEASLQVVPAMTGCTIDKTEKFYAALRRLEEFKP